MKVSVAMATYNGARYLQEQLDSFVSQTRAPDELAVCDDGSTDATVDILLRYAEQAPFNVRLFENKENLGYSKNFEKAISLCEGDLIFLSDQDDIWFPGKIETIVQAFDSNPDAVLIMNDAELTRSDGAPTGLTKLGQTLSLGLAEADFTTGCCMAFRRSFGELAIPVPWPDFVHDTWLNRLALKLQTRTLVPDVLQYYRRHEENTSGWIANRTTRLTSRDLVVAYKEQDPRPAAEKRLRQLRHLWQRLDTGSPAVLAAFGGEDRIATARKRIREEQEAVEGRLRLLGKARWRRPPGAIYFFLRGQYRYFSGWKSLTKDLLYQ